MFAYCCNNPINYSDSSGRFPWSVFLFGALLGGGINVILALMNNQSVGEVWGAGIIGALFGGASAVYPELASLIIGYNLLDRLLDCLYSGYSFEETLAIMGISALSEIAFKDTGDDLADEFVDAVFGTAKELTAEAGIIVIGNNSNGELAVNNVATATSGRAVGGGGKGYMLMYTACSVKGDLLWI